MRRHLGPEFSELPIADCQGLRLGLVYQVQTGLSYDRRAYGVRCWVKSLLSETKTAITDKSKLLANLRGRSAERFLAPSRMLRDVSEVLPGQVLLVKPVGDRTGGGRGNAIVTNAAELEAVQRQYREEQQGGIACEYIARPWLHDGRKMHLRMYFLVRAQSERAPFLAELWGRGKINTALLPYTLDPASLHDPDVHDSHMKSTEKDLNFPDDLQIPDDGLHLSDENDGTSEGTSSNCSGDDTSPSNSMPERDEGEIPQSPTIAAAERRRERVISDILAQMRDAMSHVAAILQPLAAPPPEAYFGYEVFGIDFMVATENGRPRVYLLEANTRVAYGPIGGQKRRRPFDPVRGPWTKKYTAFARDYFEWMYLYGVKPFYALPPLSSSPLTFNTPPGLVHPLDRTFIISGGTGLEHQPLRSLLLQHGFEEKRHPCSVGYLHLEKLADDLANFDSRMTSLTVGLKSLLHSSKSAIANKDRLHAAMFAEHPELAGRHMARTWPIAQVPADCQRGVLIHRPVGNVASCGRGIRMSEGAAQYEEALREMAAEKRQQRWTSIISSEYLASPLLDAGGRKFHLRMFFLVRVGPDWEQPFMSDLWPRGRIVTAAKPYAAGSWHDKEVHDTHSETTSHNMWFPEDFVEPARAAHVFAQMKDVCGALAEILQRHRCGVYPESRNGFEVFGLDFMMTSDFRVYLLEVNDKVGYRNIAEPPTAGAAYTLTPQSRHYYPNGTYTFTDFSTDYFNWIFTLVIKPLFLRQDSDSPPPHVCTFGMPQHLLHPAYSKCEIESDH